MTGEMRGLTMGLHKSYTSYTSHKFYIQQRFRLLAQA